MIDDGEAAFIVPVVTRMMGDPRFSGQDCAMIDRVLIPSLGGCARFGVLLAYELPSADGNQPAVVTAPARVEGPVAPRVRGSRIDELLATALGHPLFSATRKPAEAKADRSVEQQMPNL